MKFKPDYKAKFYRNFSLYHMFNKGYIIPDALIECIPEIEKGRLERIDKHNEEMYEKRNKN
jgi:hypothetical protein